MAKLAAIGVAAGGLLGVGGGLVTTMGIRIAAPRRIEPAGVDPGPASVEERAAEGE